MTEREEYYVIVVESAYPGVDEADVEPCVYENREEALEKCKSIVEEFRKGFFEATHTKPSVVETLIGERGLEVGSMISTAEGDEDWWCLAKIKPVKFGCEN